MLLPSQFNTSPPDIMHIDLNSCFASVEQQANPLLRDKPVAVVHSNAPYGCILAASYEAKLWGVKTGMTLADGKALCPWLISREADPPKYREVHARLGNLLNQFSDRVISKSIDEYCLILPVGAGSSRPCDPFAISQSIKSRIQSEVGDYLRVSIGVSTNQNLAKLASGLHKPNGFDIIDSHNFMDVYQKITLQDFCGINIRNEARLHRVGIFTPLQFYEASIQTLTSAFGSILGRYWHTYLHGYEVGADLPAGKAGYHPPVKSFGQSYVLPHPMLYDEWRPILAKLVAKAARRLRAHGSHATAVHLALRYSDHNHWHTSHQLHTSLFTDFDLLAATLALNPPLTQPIKKLAITFFGLRRDNHQLSCLRDYQSDQKLTLALDSLNNRYGEYIVKYGSFLGSEGHVKDAIAFGK